MRVCVFVVVFERKRKRERKKRERKTKCDIFRVSHILGFKSIEKSPSLCFSFTLYVRKRHYTQKRRREEHPLLA